VPWSVLAGAPAGWSAFLALCLYIVVAFLRDWLISGKRYDRREREWKERYERDIAAEQRVAAYAEKAREQESARADRESTRANLATAALTAQAAQLPEALRQAKAGQT
jgi:hypothetical protein